VDPAVLGRKPSHLDDAKAFVYSKPTYSNDELTKPLSQIGTGTIDVSGGWFDAGDYLKFVETTSYTEAMMLVAVRDHAAALGAGKDSFHGEGQHGIEWLLRMWDDSSQTLYYQVGIGNGSGALKINGDHDLWRLPEVDDTLPVAPGDPNYFVRFRPALRLAAAGGNISPNLAGRLAADFALCSVVYRPTDAALADRCLSSAEHVYALAHTTTSPTITTTAPKDYYPETSWRDDMELGATELYFAVAGAAGAVPAGLPHSDPAYYLGEAATWAKAYLTSKENGSDSLNLYDVSALAHYELFRALSQAGQPSGLAVGPAELIAGLASQLEAARTQGLQDPFRLGIEYGGGDAAPHAFGLALSADFYEEISGDTQYRSLGQQQRDWALGANAWGSSFVVGAGSTFPRCLQHQIANLAGSFDGTPPILRGAVVAGPTDPASLDGLAGSLLDGMLACPAGGADPFAPFSGHGAQYQDNAADWPTVEPAIDYTAPSILLFARQ
jgi:endoglucanase